MSIRPALLATLLLAACSAPPPPPAAPKAAPAPLAARDWPMPVDGGAQPALVATERGLLLAWIEKSAAGHALRFSRSTAQGWSAPRTIAEGGDWFVNWADTPHIAATPDGALWAHWLRKSAASTYAYDVVLSRSADDGATWSPPVAVNDDGTPTEHGFVSLWTEGRDRLRVAWLDGRATAGAGHDHHAGGRAMMTLRSAAFDASLARHDEAEIDASTCDCCQTDVAATARGALLVYRDRTPEEIRDIAATRLEQGAWTAPVLVNADRWTMPACPVNGPSVSARDNEAVVAWYTGAGSAPSVRFARSVDAGTHFSPPVLVDQGSEVLGRVDTALDAGGAWVAWLREDARGQSLQLARMSADGARVATRLEIARLQGRGRGTGLPRLALAGGRLHVAWTDVVDGRPRLRGAVLDAR
ncbi:sialidase family protein [Lysobacter xanthus]